MYKSFEEYIEERIHFIKSIMSIEKNEYFDYDSDSFSKALQDFTSVKSIIEKEKNGEVISWDELASVICPYISKTHQSSIQNYKDESLSNSIRLDSKSIAESLSRIWEEIISKCNNPVALTLVE